GSAYAPNTTSHLNSSGADNVHTLGGGRDSDAASWPDAICRQWRCILTSLARAVSHRAKHIALCCWDRNGRGCNRFSLGRMRRSERSTPALCCWRNARAVLSASRLDGVRAGAACRGGSGMGGSVPSQSLHCLCSFRTTFLSGRYGDCVPFLGSRLIHLGR